MQERHNSIAIAMELCFSCTKSWYNCCFNTILYLSYLYHAIYHTGKPGFLFEICPYLSNYLSLLFVAEIGNETMTPHGTHIYMYNPLAPGWHNSNFKYEILNLILRTEIFSLTCKYFSVACFKSPFMKNQHWFWWCIGGLRLQAITWTNDDWVP